MIVVVGAARAAANAQINGLGAPRRLRLTFRFQFSLTVGTSMKSFRWPPSLNHNTKKTKHPNWQQTLADEKARPISGLVGAR